MIGIMPTFVPAELRLYCILFFSSWNKLRAGVCYELCYRYS